MKRKLFINKKNNIFKKTLFLILFLLFIFFIFYNYYNKSFEYFAIPEFKGSFFIYPVNKEGKKIENLDKKTLHINDNNENIDIINNQNLNYSIQLFASNNYDKIKEKIDFFVNKNKLDIEELYIYLFEHDLGYEYLILYKSFNLKYEGYNFCSNQLRFLNKCIIVNANNLD